MNEKHPLSYRRPPAPKPRSPYWFTDRLGCLGLTLMLVPVAVPLLLDLRRAPVGISTAGVSWLIVALALGWCAAAVALVWLIRTRLRERRAERRAYEVDRPTSDT